MILLPRPFLIKNNNNSKCLKAMNHMGHVTKFLYLFFATHVHMKKDIDLKFWEIK